MKDYSKFVLYTETIPDDQNSPPVLGFKRIALEQMVEDLTVVVKPSTHLSPPSMWGTTSLGVSLLMISQMELSHLRTVLRFAARHAELMEAYEFEALQLVLAEEGWN